MLRDERYGLAVTLDQQSECRVAAVRFEVGKALAGQPLFRPPAVGPQPKEDRTMTDNGTIGISTITGDYAAAETWTGVPDELIAELRARLGEPTVRQIFPVDVLERVVDDPAMVALEPAVDPEEKP